MSTTDTAAPALKEIFNAERLQHIASEMSAVYPAFKAKAFFKHANQGLAELAVMQRMARVSESLHAVLPLDYEDSLEVLRELAPASTADSSACACRTTSPATAATPSIPPCKR